MGLALHHNLIDLTNQKFGKWLVVGPPKSAKKKTYWMCRCDCGFEKDFTSNYLRNHLTKPCTNCRFLNLKGNVYGRLTVINLLDKDVRKNKKLRLWLCKCSCGKEVQVPTGRLQNSNTTSCGCLRDERRKEPKDINFCKKVSEGKLLKRSGWTGFRGISGTLFHRLKMGAKNRIKHTAFEITIQDVWNQFVKQKGRCALTGIKLKLPEHHFEHREGKTTASLDRIDSNKGYIIDNIQWVHKNINLMKQSYSQKEFIEYCRLVTSHSNKSCLDDVGASKAMNILDDFPSSNYPAPKVVVDSSNGNIGLVPLLAIGQTTNTARYGQYANHPSLPNSYLFEIYSPNKFLILQ